MAWSLDRPRVLAILNLTPDSFSDGGVLGTAELAASAAVAAVGAGADGLDVGGESTRPGAARVEAEEQVRRVVPAIAAIRRFLGPAVPITIDTTLTTVARAALDAGASAINDVSAGLEDDAMFDLAAARRCGLIIMHRLAPPGADVYSNQYARPPDYGTVGVVGAVEAFLGSRADAAIRAGVPRESIVVDPGLGFGKTVEQNIELIEATPRLCRLGFPVLSGLSRKSFVAASAGMDMHVPPRERDALSAALSVCHWDRGASLFRVHDVAGHAAALRAAAGRSAHPPT